MTWNLRRTVPCKFRSVPGLLGARVNPRKAFVNSSPTDSARKKQEATIAVLPKAGPAKAVRVG